MRWARVAGVFLGRPWVVTAAAGPRPGALQAIVCIAVFSATYGAVMGSFGGVAGERFWQVLFSAAKVPLLLIVTFALGLPSFYVFNALWGLRQDFGQVHRALWAAQAGLALVLASLAPYTLLWYASSANYEMAVLFNGLMFGSASVAAQWLLRRHYRPLMARASGHRVLLRLWLLLYVFIGVQMAWVLRPFVGDPHQPTEFFRSEAWDNAYVIIFRTACRVLGLR